MAAAFGWGTLAASSLVIGRDARPRSRARSSRGRATAGRCGRACDRRNRKTWPPARRGDIGACHQAKPPALRWSASRGHQEFRPLACPWGVTKLRLPLWGSLRRVKTAAGFRRAVVFARDRPGSRNRSPYPGTLTYRSRALGRGPGRRFGPRQGALAPVVNEPLPSPRASRSF